MARLGKKGDRPALRLATALRAIAAQGPSALPSLDENLSAGIGRRIDDLREVLQAGPVTLDSLPPDFRRDWIAPDGRWRVQVFPKGDARDNETLRHFARTVEKITPNAVGSAVSVDEWTALAPRAFGTAGALALVTISVLLLAVLRNFRDVMMVLVPLLLAGILTLGAAALLGFSINFANIITLPMMLGIGVAFDIYFVMRHRAGEPGLLGSATARGVVFSALTTGTAFGSLAISRSPGMAEMGEIPRARAFLHPRLHSLRPACAPGKDRKQTRAIRMNPGRAPLPLLCLALALAGCATVPSDPEARAEFRANHDPIEPFNRKIFAFNLALDRFLIKPLAQGYQKIIPEEGRNALRHVLDNLNEPVVLANTLLQGRFKDARTTTCRFPRQQHRRDWRPRRRGQPQSSSEADRRPRADPVGLGVFRRPLPDAAPLRGPPIRGTASAWGRTSTSIPFATSPGRRTIPPPGDRQPHRLPTASTSGRAT